MLDNSDFTNPINQRMSGVITTKYEYPIDRWQFDKSSASINANAFYSVAYPSLQLYNKETTSGTWAALYHRVPKEKLSPGNYTLILNEHYNKDILHEIAVLIMDGETTILPSANYYPDSNRNIIVNFTLSAPPSESLLLAVYALPGKSIGFDWAALYEGTFTSDTVPVYIPKGYSVELTECQRYYQFYRSLSYPVTAWGNSTTQAAITLFLPVPMRIKNPTIIIGTPEVFIDGSGNDKTLSSYTQLNNHTGSSGIRIRTVTSTAWAKGDIGILIADVTLSADL